MMLNKTREKTGDKISRLLIAIVVMLVALTIAAQLGILKGRAMERREAAVRIAEADARAQRLGEMLSVAQKQIETLPIVQELVRCESSGRHKGVWGDGGKSYGRWQFQEATFVYLAGRAGLAGLNWQDELDQAVVGAWAMSNGYGGWWTCWKKISKDRYKTRR